MVLGAAVLCCAVLQVRVVGGAYGGFCTFDSHSGNFMYLSYRWVVVGRGAAHRPGKQACHVDLHVVGCCLYWANHQSCKCACCGTVCPNHVLSPTFW